MRSARVFASTLALTLAATAAFALARVAAAGDRPCKQDDRTCKHGETTGTTTTTTTTTAKHSTSTTKTSTVAAPAKTTTTKSASASPAKTAPAKGATASSAKAKAAAKPSTKAAEKAKPKPKPTATAHHAAAKTGKTKKAKPAATTSAAVVNLVDHPFVCNGPVHLASVTVTIRNVSSDAVLLRNGCTGSIGRINIVQYHGDGIKVGAAHDLVVGGGSIRCYAHDVGKHQDGIQVLGGRNVTFSGMDVGCYSANNSQVWINDGAGSGPGGTPTNIVFQGGKFQGYFNGGQYGPGGAYGVAIVGSVQSGVRNATICPNAHPAHALYVGTSAQAPVTAGTVVSRTC